MIYFEMKHYMLSVVKFFSLLLGEMVVFDLTLENSGTSGEKYAKSAWVCAKWFQSCPTLWHSLDHSSPGSSVHATLQPRTLEWVAMPCYRGSSLPRNRTRFPSISCLGRQAGSLPVAPPTGEKYAKKFSSVAQSCPTLCDPTAARQASPSITNSQSLFKLVSIEPVRPNSMWVKQNKGRTACSYHTHSSAL